jgi:hypothetical protein
MSDRFRFYRRWAAVVTGPPGRARQTARRLRLAVLGVLLLGASLPVSSVGASVAQPSPSAAQPSVAQSPPPPPCPSPGVLSGNTCTYTFLSNAPSSQQLQIPANVTMKITADGSSGGAGEDATDTLDGTPGLGGQSVGTFGVTSAQMLTILVGDRGAQSEAGGEGGGGFGDSNFNGNSLEQGGKGGGGSYVFGPTGAPLVVAGGGGGTGAGNSSVNQLGGAGGGDGPGGPGVAGTGTGPGDGGSGGGATTPGAGGAAGPPSGGGTAPQAGQAGKGPVTGPTDPNITDGDGGLDTQGGYGGGGGLPGDTGNTGMAGGGGGGYTGGGGGGDSASGGGGSGGGGSGFVAASAISASGSPGIWGGNGQVVVSYTNGCLPANSTDLSLTLTHTPAGASDQYTLTATNTTTGQLPCVDVKVTISPIFNSTGRPTAISPAATSVTWGPLPGSQKGTITWSDLSFTAGESKTFKYTLTRASAPAVGQVTNLSQSWLDWTKPGQANAVNGTGGQLILSDTPETIKAGSAGNGKAGADIEGVLYKQPQALSPGAGTEDGEFRFFSEHVNRSNVGAAGSQGDPKDFLIVLHNTSKDVVTITRGITAAKMDQFEDLAGPDTEVNFMTQLQASGNTGCSGQGTAIQPDGTLVLPETTTPVPVKDTVVATDDFCASPSGDDLQVGEVMVDSSDATAFKAHPRSYKFKVAGGTFFTDAGLPASNHGRGTYPHAGRDVTLPDAVTYDVTKAVAFGWKIGPKDTSDPQYEPPLDGSTPFAGNYGVLFNINVSLANGTADTPVQVLLNPRAGGFGVGVLSDAGGQVTLIKVRLKDFKSKLSVLGVGQIPGAQSMPFNLRIMPPAGTFLPAGVIIAPMYTMSVASATWGQQPSATTTSNNEFVPN